MTLIHVVLVLIVVGVLLWVVTNYIPMDARISKLMTIVVIIVVVLWLVSLFLPGYLPTPVKLK